MSSKKTKGKQKINIEKIEKDEDRSVTQSKRRNGIYTKICQLSILCGAEVAFLGYSISGKPYTFGSPTFQDVAERFLNGEASSSSSTLHRSIVDAHHKAKINELCEMYNSLMDKKRAEEEKAMEARAVTVEVLPVEENAWWKLDLTEVNDVEVVKQLLEKNEQLYESLCEGAAAKIQSVEKNNK